MRHALVPMALALAVGSSLAGAAYAEEDDALAAACGTLVRLSAELGVETPSVASAEACRGKLGGLRDACVNSDEVFGCVAAIEASDEQTLERSLMRCAVRCDVRTDEPAARPAPSPLARQACVNLDALAERIPKLGSELRDEVACHDAMADVHEDCVNADAVFECIAAVEGDDELAFNQGMLECAQVCEKR